MRPPAQDRDCSRGCGGSAKHLCCAGFSAAPGWSLRRGLLLRRIVTASSWQFSGLCGAQSPENRQFVFNAWPPPFPVPAASLGARRRRRFVSAGAVGGSPVLDAVGKGKAAVSQPVSCLHGFTCFTRELRRRGAYPPAARSFCEPAGQGGRGAGNARRRAGGCA